MEDLQEKFVTDFPMSGGFLYGISRKFEVWLNSEVGMELKKVNKVCVPEYELILSEVADYYRYSVRHFRQIMDDRLFQFFGTHLPEKYLEIEFTGVDVPDTSVYRVFDSHLDTLLFFLPMKIFHAVFFRHFHRQIAMETEKNLHRYISDLNEKFIKSIDQIHKQALRHIGNEIGTVEGILQNTDTDVEKLRTYLNRLLEIKQSLVG